MRVYVISDKELCVAKVGITENSAYRRIREHMGVAANSYFVVCETAHLDASDAKTVESAVIDWAIGQGFKHAFGRETFFGDARIFAKQLRQILQRQGFEDAWAVDCSHVAKPRNQDEYAGPSLFTESSNNELEQRAKGFVARRKPAERAEFLKVRLARLEGVLKVQLQSSPLHLHVTIDKKLPPDAPTPCKVRKWCDLLTVPYTLRPYPALGDPNLIPIYRHAESTSSNQPPDPKLKKPSLARELGVHLGESGNLVITCPYCVERQPVEIGAPGPVKCTNCGRCFYVDSRFGKPFSKVGIQGGQSSTDVHLRRADCASCGQILRIPFNRKGFATCPRCAMKTLFDSEMW